jgi:hypothetical protein
MPEELQNCIIGIVGRKGSGKSTALREVVNSQSRVVIFDAMAEHRSPNVFYDPDDCLDFLERNRKRPLFHCALRPRADEEDALNGLAEEVFRIGYICFAVEEVPWFSTASSQPEGLDKLARMGRHRQVDLVWTAQRMTEVSRRLTSATDVFVLFSMTEPRDLNALAERCGPEVAGKVQDLGLHGRLVYDVLKGGTVRV